MVHTDFQHVARNTLRSDELVVRHEHESRIEREESLYRRKGIKVGLKEARFHGKANCGERD